MLTHPGGGLMPLRLWKSTNFTPITKSSPVRPMPGRLSLEWFITIQISKLKAEGATVSVYDPMHDRTVPISIDRRGRYFLNLTLSATDYPYLLIIQEREK